MVDERNAWSLSGYTLLIPSLLRQLADSRSRVWCLPSTEQHANSVPDFPTHTTRRPQRWQLYFSPLSRTPILTTTAIFTNISNDRAIVRLAGHVRELSVSLDSICR
jgi:hypothetical protein